MSLLEKLRKDEELPFPAKKNTGQPIKDAMYNWVVNRYRKNNHPWKNSDEKVFGGAIYFVLDYIFIVMWIWAYWLIITSSLKHFGFERTVFVAGVFILMRINALIKGINELNKKF